MILLETHLHNIEASPCAQLLAEEIPPVYLKAGYGAIAVTNHYSAYNINAFIKGNSAVEKVHYFLEASKLLTNAAKKNGLKAYLSAEITLAKYQWQDYLVYGDLEEGLINNPDIYSYSQAQLFEAAEQYGWAIFQAHPFRTGCSVGIPRYMHGIEVYNGAHIDEEIYERGKEFCKKNNLKMISGGDFHNFGNEAEAGIFIPDDINTEVELAKFLRNEQSVLFMKNKYE